MDFGIGKEDVGIGVFARATEEMFRKTKWTIEKYAGDREAIEKGLKPFEVLEFEGNVLLTEGITELWDLFCETGSPQAFDTDHAYIGIGDTDTAASSDQTDILGSNKAYQPMEAGYPSVSTNKAYWKSQFDTNEGNFDWEEITVSNTGDGTGVNLCRKVQAMGTKAAGTTWVVTLEVSLT